jgi:hypothetical protein
LIEPLLDVKIDLAMHAAPARQFGHRLACRLHCLTD